MGKGTVGLEDDLEMFEEIVVLRTWLLMVRSL